MGFFLFIYAHYLFVLLLLFFLGCLTFGVGPMIDCHDLQWSAFLFFNFFPQQQPW